MELVEITYYRGENKDVSQTAIVTAQQVQDIKTLLPHIRIIKCASAPMGSKRDYLLR